MSRIESAPERTTASGLATLLRCFTYVKPYTAYVVTAAILMLAINALVVITPQFMRFIVDEGIARADVRYLGFLVLMLLALIILKGVMTFFQGRLSEKSSQGVAYDLRREIHKHLTTLSFSFHDKTESGQLLARAIQDVERIRFLTGRATLRLVEGTVLLVATGAVMVSMNPKLSIVALVAMPLLVFLAIRYGRTIRPLSLRIQNQLAVLTTRLEQNLRGARIVKAFAQEQRETERFEAQNAAWFALSARSAKIQAINGPLLTYVAQMMTVFVIGLGGFFIVDGTLTYGELVAFTAYIAQLAQPVRMMGMVAPMIGMAISSGERIFEILDATSEVSQDSDAHELTELSGEVVFENVSFSYSHRDHAIRDVSFTVKPGEVVAFLGATGSGKSTVLNLIPRFYNPTAGRILIDGHDTMHVKTRSLRNQIGIVLQDTILFADTIRENIRFGRHGATDDEVVDAAKAAQAHEFILEMPEGYETRVGEMGRTLSGGQKQRIAIARAILLDPRILLLDDATSSVDTETEHLIQIALQRLMEGRTAFIIAQRLSTLRMASRVIVMENGSITAEGRHDELYASSPLYREVYEHQIARVESPEANA